MQQVMFNHIRVLWLVAIWFEHIIGLKRIVNLLSGYPDANIYGFPKDSDIIRLVLLAMYFKFISTSSAKYNGLSIIIILIST